MDRLCVPGKPSAYGDGTATQKVQLGLISTPKELSPRRGRAKGFSDTAARQAEEGG